MYVFLNKIKNIFESELTFQQNMTSYITIEYRIVFAKKFSVSHNNTFI